ncbi:putative membrane protein [Clostridium bornimense]|uniref:Putative membrane protein n=1 Tax=Clostridium bornimense TaxID=1216932 RepID=W6RXU7_9CLOT|nr:hypothetical protein [Clostridium bornimense]CDM69481.1 putative membrane protein [Clostridium bornimense]
MEIKSKKIKTWTVATMFIIISLIAAPFALVILLTYGIYYYCKKIKLDITIRRSSIE